MKNYHLDKYCRIGKSMAITAGIVAGTVLLAAAMLMVIGLLHPPPAMAGADEAEVMRAVGATKFELNE